MSRSFAELTDEALRLSPQDQLRLARVLLEQSEAVGDLEVEAAWEEEIERRIELVDSGLAKDTRRSRTSGEGIQQVGRLL
jgi:hypothetical protein